MATVSERLDALESIQEDSAALQDRFAALEEQIKSFTKDLEAGEKQFDFLKELPDKRAKDLEEVRTKITAGLSQFADAVKEMKEPFDGKIQEITLRLKRMEKAVGISN